MGESELNAEAAHPKWVTATASLMAGAAFFSLWFLLLPEWLDFRVEAAEAAPWR